jgi:transcriptional regulator with XRE-family HTH domain
VSPLEGANPALADVIRRLREDRGITQEDLAHEAGVTTGTLSRIERGLANPAWTTVARIARALGVSLEELGAAVERFDRS